jgi:predicted RNase H-like nuclease
MTQRLIAGVDGCKAGWLVALAGAWPCVERPRVLVCASFAEAMQATFACAAVAVDMPIGLPGDGSDRECDRAARQRLPSKAKPSVFPAPPRGCMDACTWEEFSALHRSLAGKRATKQVWNIAARMREVDMALTPAHQARVVEAHPELVFRHTLGGLDLAPKRTLRGLAQRLRLLASRTPELLDLAAGLNPAQAGVDDLLDALALLAVAAHVAAVGVDAATPRRLPATPPLDPRGLRMEIWF